MSITGVSPANHTIVDPTGSGVTLSWTTQNTQTHYQVIYRRVGASTWVDSGKVASTTRSHTIPGSALVKNAYYEWRVRYWYGTSGQSPWTASNIFKAQVPSIGRIRVSGGGTKTVDLRVVPLGKSELPSNVRVRLPSGTGELDLVPTGSPIESGVRVAVKAGVVRGVAKPMPDQYTNYANHSNTGYSRYDNHSDTGYGRYDNHTDTGYTRYDDHTDTGYTRYGNHTDTGYSRYDNHSDTGYSRYDNHTDTGYDDYYSEYSKSGYSKYSDHTNYTEGYYTNHDNTGYRVYPDHADYLEYSYHDSGHTDYLEYSYHDSGHGLLFRELLNHNDNGEYNRYSDSGYTAYSNHEDEGYNSIQGIREWVL